MEQDAARARLAEAQRRLDEDEGDVVAWRRLFSSLTALGKQQVVERHVDRALALHGQDAQLHFLAGVSASRRGALALASRRFERATVLDPGLVEGWVRLGTTRFRLGQIREAEAPLLQALGLDPDGSQVRTALASVWLRLARAEEAYALLAPVIEQNPSPEVLTTWARACLSTGRAQVAYDQLSGVVSEHSDSSLLSFAWGDVCERLGRIDEAFRGYDNGNAVMGRTWNDAAHERQVRSTIAAFDHGALSTSARASRSGKSVLLIVGMPRSGSSLLEQALAQHEHIGGGGELDLLRRLSIRLGKAVDGKPLPFCRPKLVSQAVYDQLSGAYHDELRRRAGDGLIRIDKTPDNAFHLGLASLVLPDVRVLYLTRSPLDVGWSCFRTAFGDGLAWSRDLQHIAVYQARLRAVMEHWTQTLSSPPLHVRYEDVVSDPESELRRITDWLQLDWDPAVLEHHHSARLVTTASHTQVRDALHRGYVGRSEPYRAYLKALVD